MSLASHLIEPARVLALLMRHRRALQSPGQAPDADAHASATDAAVDEDEAAAFVADLEALGPAFVKFGQVLSTRPDLIHPAYAAALERTQDTCRPIDFGTVREVVEAELGARLSKLFADVEESPIGVASLAQVHRATMRDGWPSCAARWSPSWTTARKRRTSSASAAICPPRMASWCRRRCCTCAPAACW